MIRSVDKHSIPTALGSELVKVVIATPGQVWKRLPKASVNHHPYLLRVRRTAWFVSISCPTVEAVYGSELKSRQPGKLGHVISEAHYGESTLPQELLQVGGWQCNASESQPTLADRLFGSKLEEPEVTGSNV